MSKHTTTGNGKGHTGYSNRLDRVTAENAIQRQMLINKLWRPSITVYSAHP